MWNTEGKKGIQAGKTPEKENRKVKGPKPTAYSLKGGKALL